MTKSKQTIIQVIFSILAAAIGVQSDRNRKRDFEQGSPGVYVVAGIVATLLFVLLLVMIVNMVV